MRYKIVKSKGNFIVYYQDTKTPIFIKFIINILSFLITFDTMPSWEYIKTFNTYKEALEYIEIEPITIIEQKS